MRSLTCDVDSDGVKFAHRDAELEVGENASVSFLNGFLEFKEGEARSLQRAGLWQSQSAVAVHDQVGAQFAVTPNVDLDFVAGCHYVVGPHGGEHEHIWAALREEVHAEALKVVAQVVEHTAALDLTRVEPQGVHFYLVG